jgi:hypothetical protein
VTGRGEHRTGHDPTIGAATDNKRPGRIPSPKLWITHTTFRLVDIEEVNLTLITAALLSQ